MKKIKVLSSMALASILAVSSIATVGAAPADTAPTHDTTVNYVTNSASPDAEGSYVIVFPADVNLALNHTTDKLDVRLQEVEGKDLPENLNVEIKVSSPNADANSAHMVKDNLKIPYTAAWGTTELKGTPQNNKVETVIGSLGNNTKEIAGTATIDPNNAEVKKANLKPGVKYTDTLTFTATQKSPTA